MSEPNEEPPAGDGVLHSMGTTGASGTAGIELIDEGDQPAGSDLPAAAPGLGGEADRPGTPYDALADEQEQPHRAPRWSAGPG